jgi:hypothetical protein
LGGTPIFALDANSKRNLHDLIITMDGTVEVTLPANAEVVAQNANGLPGGLAWTGLFNKAYVRNIGLIEQMPFIQLRLKR